MYHYKGTLKTNAQKLRRAMTPEEIHLWLDFLKNLPITVKRQACIASYIVDFYIAKEKIVIELDGRQHTAPENKEADQKRDDCLKNFGITVLRYRNEDINNHFWAVCEDILKKLKLDENVAF